jgi:hypothetical protein
MLSQEEYIFQENPEEERYFNSILFFDLDKYNNVPKKDSQETPSLGVNSIHRCLTDDLLQQIDETKPEDEQQQQEPTYIEPKPIEIHHPRPKKKKLKIKAKKNFEEREGDWVCYYCKNLNFSFRDNCNRCNALKNDSEEKHDIYIENVLQIIKENERIRNDNLIQNNNCLSLK